MYYDHRYTASCHARSPGGSVVEWFSLSAASWQSGAQMTMLIHDLIILTVAVMAGAGAWWWWCRGQAFDILSSQANIAGYRAVVEVSQCMGLIC